jgi:hypothetical protein
VSYVDHGRSKPGGWRGVVVLASALVALTAGCGSSAQAPGPGTSSTAASPPATQAVSPSAEVIAQRMGLTTLPGYVAYTASTDPNHLLGRQNGYTSKINWGPDGNTGTIEVFPDQADAIARQDYIKGFTCPVGFGYLIMQGTADLRLGCDLTPAQAAPLEARFRAAAH